MRKDTASLTIGHALVQGVPLAQDKKNPALDLSELKSWAMGTLCKMMKESLLSESRDRFAQAKSSLSLAHSNHIKKGGYLFPNM